MSVKSWGDGWVTELLPPKTISFLLPVHLKVVDGHQVLHPMAWSFKSSAERSLFPQQYLNVPGAEDLKPDSHQRTFVLCEIQQMEEQDKNWEMNWTMGDRWADCRHNSDELWWVFSHFGAEAVQTLTGSNRAFAWGSHSLAPGFSEKAKRRQTWKGNPLHNALCHEFL